MLLNLKLILFAFLRKKVFCSTFLILQFSVSKPNMKRKINAFLKWIKMVFVHSVVKKNPIPHSVLIVAGDNFPLKKDIFGQRVKKMAIFCFVQHQSQW